MTACAFHPDGHLFVLGTTLGGVKILSTETGEEMRSFELHDTTPVKALAFSENGYWLAVASNKSRNIVIFDLRKEGDAAWAKELQSIGPVRSLAWDYSGQYLAAAGPDGVAVHQYVKSTKTWSTALEVKGNAVAVRWGDLAKRLIWADSQGWVSVHGLEEITGPVEV